MADTDVNSTAIQLSGLALDSTMSTIGGTRAVYSNGTMTGVFYLGWSYFDNTGSSAPTLDDVKTYLTTPGNLSWGFGTKVGTQGTFDDNGWTVSTTDNGYEHDINAQPTLVSGNKTKQQRNTTSNLSGVIPFYILPVKGDNATHDIYCMVTEGGASTLGLGASYPAVECHVWGFNENDFEFVVNGEANESGAELRELRYVESYLNHTPPYKMGKWIDFEPKSTDYNTDTSQSDTSGINTPFRADPQKGSYFNQRFNILHLDSSSTRIVYLIENGDLGRNLNSLNTAYETVDPYLYSSDGFQKTHWLQPSNLRSHVFDSSTTLGPLVGTQKSISISAMLDNETSDCPVTVDNYHQGDNYHSVYLTAEDCFGTQIKFTVDLDEKGDGSYYTWQILAASQA